LWRKTRPYAFATVVVFHFFTHLLFVIGVFPFLMVSGATLFFDADWPRTLLRRIRGLAPVTERAEASLRIGEPAERQPKEGRWSTGAAILVAAYCVVQVVMPLRAYLYPGDVLWHEQGMRYSWRVMVREKNGSIGYRVRWRDADREVHVSPSRYLTSHQEREMSGQPDLILQLARQIARDFEERGHQDVEVRVDALVSLNGRRAAPMIDPEANLARETDTVAAMRWIAPSPPGAPLPAHPQHDDSSSRVATTRRAAR